MPPLAAGLVAGLAAGGCESHRSEAGSDRSLTASYHTRTLRTDVPGRTRVPAVAAAAQEVLRDRGYAVSESRVTEDSARVVGVPQGGGMFEKVKVDARARGEDTRIEVICEPWGNQNTSRALMDAILTRLGL